jgi:hypothetical protein
MGCIFGHLLGNQSEATLQVFMTLRRSSNQREALEVAAKHSLPPEVKDAFAALMSLYKRFESERNDLAHGCFGVVTEREDILLWTALKDLVHFLHDNVVGEKSGTHRADTHELLKKNMYVYTLASLERLYEEMKEVWTAAFHLDGYLRNPTEAHRQRQLVECNDLPMIKAEIASLKSKGLT